ncbi:MAG: efflux RND transporter periplasmic adaptor subunit [Paludibacteraceae bacterium]
MKNFKFLVISLLALIVVLNSCGNSAKKNAKPAGQKPVVRISQVFERNVSQEENFTATVEPEVQNSIAPSVPGRIRRIMVEVGNRVGAGQRIVQMDGVNLSNYQTQIANLRTNYKRVSELFAAGGASQQDVDNIKAQLDQAEATMQNLSENTYLTSPISGVVTAKNYNNGDMYSGQMPVLTVMQINPVKLIINVSEMYFTKVKVGMPVNISFDVYPNERFSGKISLIYPTIDERSRTFPVEIRLQNNNSRVRPGMFGRVNLNFGTTNHVVVPDRAIVKQVGSGARFVYVYKDGKVNYNEVKLGQRFESEYELLSGVASGSFVVVAGQSRLVDGASVEVAK